MESELKAHKYLFNPVLKKIQKVSEHKKWCIFLKQDNSDMLFSERCSIIEIPYSFLSNCVKNYM